MVDIKTNLQQLRKEIPENVELVVVTKTRTNEEIMVAYNAGERVFGENKVQELIAKQPQLPDDIQWHMIGHLQTNKVKYIAGWVSMIEAVDRMKLLRYINKEAKKHDRVIPCLLQFHIAEEETKFGLSIEEAQEILNSDEFQKMEHVKICGVMGMATFTDDMEKVSREFRHLSNIFGQIKRQFFADDKGFREISMGMSNDYKGALNEGTTMLRIGSTIFGPRPNA
ncbi:MAG: YggS family pyridoxal phosphate-dependent enzyme [Bacteroidales bacterium]